jgi:hypothetical protein
VLLSDEGLSGWNGVGPVYTGSNPTTYLMLNQSRKYQSKSYSISAFTTLTITFYAAVYQSSCDSYNVPSFVATLNSYPSSVKQLLPQTFPAEASAWTYYSVNWGIQSLDGSVLTLNVSTSFGYNHSIAIASIRVLQCSATTPPPPSLTQVFPTCPNRSFGTLCPSCLSNGKNDGQKKERKKERKR